ncbi:hypothetical protein L6R52_28795 [Myxococcota bacterium]|nr:hypothetical protein [Myxococcota bacterium]
MHQHVVLNAIEELLEVEIDGDRLARFGGALDVPDGLVRVSSGSEAEARLREARVEPRCEDLRDGMLDQAIPSVPMTMRHLPRWLLL